MHVFKQLLSLIFSTTIGLSALAQVPSDNPYQTRYGTTNHWTNTLKWNNVTAATSVPGLIGAGNVVDSLALQNVISGISSSGGGVLYFPADTFRFGFDLIVPTGVILRGATPTQTNALDDNYRPGTIFLFPKYIPTFSGNGTPNNTAFKEIAGAANGHDIALVNLDINRAAIAFHPEQWQDAPGVSTKWPVDINYNILIFGVRSNNVAIPDPGVPAPASGNEPAQEGWQRYVWRFTSNIGLYVSKNGVIANCRVNDEPTDSYNQPGYILRNATHVNCFSNGVSKLAADGSDAKFEVTDHIGIDLNRAKINKEGQGSGTGPNGKYGIYGFVTYATPATEPQLFATGNEVRDCYVFKTRRVGIIAAGNGLIVDNNRVRDRFNKIAFIRANGQGCETNNSATHENRGMDVSGWNLSVTRNDIEVQQHRIGGPTGYPSVDGEGILVQECCGGTSVKDYSFKFNKLTQASTGYIGLWKMRTMYNVHIDSNDLGCKNIYLTANTNGAPFGLYNSSMVGNSNVSGIQSNADLGGSNLLVDGNAFCGQGVINVPGFATVTPNNGGATVNPGPGPVVQVPTITVLSPTQNEVVQGGSLALIQAQVTDADSIQFFVNSTPITAYVAASQTSQTWTAPDEAGLYFISVRAKNANGVTWSNTIRIEVQVQVSVKPFAQGKLPVLAQPNPSKGVFKLSFPANETESRYEVVDYSGKVLASGRAMANETEVDLSALPSGIYQLRLIQGQHAGSVRLVKQ